LQLAICQWAVIFLKHTDLCKHFVKMGKEAKTLECECLGSEKCRSLKWEDYLKPKGSVDPPTFSYWIQAKALRQTNILMF